MTIDELKAYKRKAKNQRDNWKARAIAAQECLREAISDLRVDIGGMQLGKADPLRVRFEAQLARWQKAADDIDTANAERLRSPRLGGDKQDALVGRSEGT